MYWWGPSAQTKLFIDRWYYGLDYAMMRGKRMVILSPHEDGDPTTADYVFGGLQRAARHIGMEFVGACRAVACARGEAAANRSAMDEALRLGRALAARA